MLAINQFNIWLFSKMLLLIERLANVYAGEGVKTSTSFDDLILHSKPQVLPGDDLRRTLAGVLRRYLSPITASKLVENLGESVGDYTLTRDEKDNCFTLLINVDLIVNMTNGTEVVASNTVIFPAILFQLYQIN